MFYASQKYYTKLKLNREKRRAGVQLASQLMAPPCSGQLIGERQGGLHSL